MSITTTGRVALLALALGCPLVIGGPGSGFAQAPAFTDLPVAETSLGALLPPVAASDDDLHVLALQDGRLVVVVQEELRVLARASSDGGATFGPEIELFGGVAGGAGRLAAHGHVAALAADGVAYVLAAVRDPAGTIGLQVVRSLDMGQTWSAPADVVRAPSQVQTWATGTIALAAGPGGHLVAVYSDEYLWYARSSADAGQSWSPAVRLNLADSTAYGNPWADALFDGSGRVHVALGTRRSATSLVEYARSFDGGATFEPARTLTLGRYPDVELAADGGVLVALRESMAIVVKRSVDGGGTFATVSLPVPDVSFQFPKIAASPVDGTVLVVASAYGIGATPSPLFAWRSADHGASFGDVQRLADAVLASTAPWFAVVRTAAGRWAVAWSDQRVTDMAGLDSEAYVRVSTDDGATWGPEQRASRPAAPSLERVPRHGLAASGVDALFVAYLSGRDDAGRQRNVYANRSAADPLAFGADARLDEDAGSPLHPEVLDLDLAAAGSSTLYAALAAAADDAYPDVYVARSDDAGRTWAPALRATPFAPGTRIASLPRIAARDDGHVIVVYQSDVAAGTREIRALASSDGGRTWPASDALVGPTYQPCGAPVSTCTTDRYMIEGPLVALGPPGVVYAAWSAKREMWFARSLDDGRAFTPVSLGRWPEDLVEVPVLCASGDRVVVAFLHETPEMTLTIYARASVDRGATFGPLESLGDSWDWLLSCAASPAGDVLVTWAAAEGPSVRRWRGGAWDQAATLPDGYPSDVAYLSPEVALVAYTSGGADGDTAYVARSTDGGLTFPVITRVDDVAPRPRAKSYRPHLLTAGGADAWVVFEDYSAGSSSGADWSGNLSVAVRHSTDGAAWGPLYRADTALPAGLPTTVARVRDEASAALPGVAFPAFLASRAALRNDARVNAFDPRDLDRDLAPGASDCNDLDPGAFAVPAEAGPLGVRAGAAGATGASASYGWPSLATQAGPGTTYDVVTGSLAGLRENAGFADAACLASALPATTYDDARPLPPPGDGSYVLVRGVNACGRGTMGDGTPLPDPRDALDAMPCP